LVRSKRSMHVLNKSPDIRIGNLFEASLRPL
jgi:hypothetical protein